MAKKMPHPGEAEIKGLLAEEDAEVDQMYRESSGGTGNVVALTADSEAERLIAMWRDNGLTPREAVCAVCSDVPDKAKFDWADALWFVQTGIDIRKRIEAAS